MPDAAPDTPRAIWLDARYRDYLATIADKYDDLALKEIVDAWDAAPADPTEDCWNAELAQWDDPESINEWAAEIIRGHIATCLATLGYPKECSL